MQAAVELHVSAICSLASKGAEAAWEIGSHYNALREGHLVSRIGLGDTRQYLAARLEGRLDASMVELFATVQRSFPKEAVETYGPMRLYRLFAYLNRVGAPLPATLEQIEQVEVDVPDDLGRPVRKRFPYCSGREVARATRKVLLEQVLKRNDDCRPLERAAEEIAKATRTWCVAKIVLNGHRPVLQISRFSKEWLEPIGNALLAAAAAFKNQPEPTATPSDAGAPAPARRRG